jgi:YggT family protein
MNAVGEVLGMVLNMMLMIVILRAIISWVNPDPYNPIVKFLTGSTEPFLRPLRKALPLSAGRLDFAPLILLLLICFLQAFLVQTLKDYALQFRASALIGS